MTDKRTLLVELGCEELPPKALNVLRDAFFSGVAQRLAKAGFEFDEGASRAYSTPRRMALMLMGIEGRQPDQVIERRGPAVAQAFNEDGEPTPAALGFARSVGLDISDIGRLKTDQGEWLNATVEKPGAALGDVLFPALQSALDALPVPKPMRWSDHDYRFIRPVHWLVVLHGDDVVDGSVFGLTAGRTTRGHRVHAAGSHAIDQADDYLDVLNKAFVLADQDERKALIEKQAKTAGSQAGGETHLDPALLDEVTNIVEWPIALTGRFDERFLKVPSEALVASMQDHQKFFPIRDSSGQLTPQFVAMANLESKDPAVVVSGYERVITPRLADARFFWDQDLKTPLENHGAALDNVIFQKKLGTLGDKTRRIASLSGKIAGLGGGDAGLATRAATLSKCDLMSEMVGEFPALQGTMGRYYAAAQGEPDSVARAIEEHYLPRFAGDAVPQSVISQSVALSDKLDTLVGIFGIGMKPTGTKDPFALRRAALGVVRILDEGKIAAPLSQLLDWAIAGFTSQGLEIAADTARDIREFTLERFRAQYREGGGDTRVFSAVLEAESNHIADISSRLEAVESFMRRPEAEALAAANKRISNIINKADPDDLGEKGDIKATLDEERVLLDEINSIESAISPLIKRCDYTQALEHLAKLQGPVDRFFDEVMVMDPDTEKRRSRLALLSRLKHAFAQIADISQLG